MAFSTGMIFEARTTGSDTACSGGFNPENPNFSTDGAATNANTGSPVFTSVSYTFIAGDVGAKLFIQSGTNWIPGWYEIASVSGGAATLTASTGSSILYNGAHGTNNNTLTLNTVNGCATVASPTGAKWGIDYSQQNSAAISFTDMVIDAVTNTRFTSAANPVGVNFLGNTINVTSGTGFTVQIVEISSIVSGTIAVCDKSLGTTGSTGGNGYMGGALAGPQIALAYAANGNRIYIKSGAYTISSTFANNSNGRIDVSTNTHVEGYETYRGDLGAKPVFTASGITNATLLNIGSNKKVVNIEINGASLTGMIGVNGSTNSMLIHSNVKNCTTGVRDTFNYNCYAYNCSTSGFSFSSINAQCLNCVAESCAYGFYSGSNSYLVNCIAFGCSTAGFSDISAAPGSTRYSNCTSYNNLHGFYAQSSSSVPFFYRCISVGNSGYGYKFNTGSGYAIECAGYNNTSGNFDYNIGSTATNLYVYDFITLTSSPFTNAAGEDFSLNNTAGGGAELKGLQFDFPGISSTSSYEDVGAAQSEATTGGGETSHVSG